MDEPYSKSQLMEGTSFYIAIWAMLDIAVVYSFTADEDAISWSLWLTNQVWLFMLISKFLLVVGRIKVDYFHSSDELAIALWFMCASFVAAGCAQAGVMTTFFVLSYQDCTLIAGIVEDGHSISDVLIWNHLRHVTVCFLHLLVYFSERRFISRVANECLGPGRLYRFFWTAVSVPIVLGLLHSWTSDDQKVYRYRDSAVGVRCMICYGVTVLIAATYYTYGPIRTIYMDSKQPYTLAIAIDLDLSKDRQQVAGLTVSCTNK
jgi:hypothetical protein